MGTILSLWDAAALDAAGQDGEVAPSFINLADASIKMVNYEQAKKYLAKMLTRDRLRRYPLVPKTYSLCRMSSAYQQPARIDTFSILIRFIPLPNGLLESGLPCSKMLPCKKLTLAR